MRREGQIIAESMRTFYSYWPQGHFVPTGIGNLGWNAREFEPLNIPLYLSKA